MNEKMGFHVSLKLTQNYETANFESSHNDADKHLCLLGYYIVLISRGVPHFRGAMLLQNEANILPKQQNIPDNLDLGNVAVHDNICKLRTLLPFCTYYADETLDAFQKIYALKMESLPYTQRNHWKLPSNREMKGIISDTISILIFTNTSTGGEQVTYNKKCG